MPRPYFPRAKPPRREVYRRPPSRATENTEIQTRPRLPALAGFVPFVFFVVRDYAAGHGS